MIYSQILSDLNIHAIKCTLPALVTKCYKLTILKKIVLQRLENLNFGVIQYLWAGNLTALMCIL